MKIPYHNRKQNGFLWDVKGLDLFFENKFLDEVIRSRMNKTVETKQTPPPFSGTKSQWKTSNGRLIHVHKLTTPHLLNIMDRLKEIATERLCNEYPGEQYNPSLELITKWLDEYCITFDSLVDECKIRNCWNGDYCIKPPPREARAKSYQKETHERLIKMLEDRVSELESSIKRIYDTLY